MCMWAKCLFARKMEENVMQVNVSEVPQVIKAFSRQSLKLDFIQIVIIAGLSLRPLQGQCHETLRTIDFYFYTFPPHKQNFKRMIILFGFNSSLRF